MALSAFVCSKLEYLSLLAQTNADDSQAKETFVREVLTRIANMPLVGMAEAKIVIAAINNSSLVEAD
jgi:hypothetical protein